MSNGVKNKTVVQASQHTLTMYQGPLPPPQDLDRYNQIQPGFAERLLAMAESEAVHRRDLERKQVDAQGTDLVAYHREVRSGQVCATIIALSALAAGAYAATHGGQIAGALIGGGGLAGLVTAFVVGRKSSR